MRWRSSVVRSVWVTTREGWNRRNARSRRYGTSWRAMSKCGIEAAPDALDGHQRADQEDQVGRDVQVMGADEADQLAEQRTQVDGLERQLGIGGDQLADVAAEAAGVELLAPDVERLERADDAIGVLGQEADQQVGDPLAGLAVEPAEHAVIQRGDDPAVQHAEVARMRVGVEEAELEDLLQEDPRPGHGDVGRVGARSPGCRPGRRSRPPR